MDNKTNSETASETSDTGNNQINEYANPSIIETGANSTTVEVETSLLEISSILSYLAECDNQQAAFGADFQSDLSYGRHYLMQMLSSCVNHFYECAERVAEQTIQLQNMVESNKAQTSKQVDGLVKLHGLYKALVEFKEDGARADFDKLKMDIKACESSLSLVQNKALVALQPGRLI